MARIKVSSTKNRPSKIEVRGTGKKTEKPHSQYCACWRCTRKARLKLFNQDKGNQSNSK